MLSQFMVRRHFNKLSARLYVDLESKEAAISLIYDRLLVEDQDLSAADFEKVKTPEMAEAWLSKPIGEHGTLIETLEQRYRRMVIAA
jgi:signal transduction protein with GAF and PtsI domain